VRDALGILERNWGRLDFDYIELMCKSLSILDKWKEFLGKLEDENEEKGLPAALLLSALFNGHCHFAPCIRP
jgi:hypothetical protein